MNAIERLFARLTFSGTRKTRIMRQIQRLVRAGVPLPRTLEMLWKLYSKEGRKPREPLAMMIAEWQSRLRQGKSFSESMHGWISIAEELIIEAGEQSDKLAKALEDALKANTAGKKIRNTILGALIYPVFLIGVVIFMLRGFSTEIAPTFATILPVEEWPSTAQRIYMAARFFTDWLAIIGMIAGSAIASSLLSLPVLGGPVRRYLDYIPPWSIYKVTQGASFMISMRGFISAGVTIPDALRNMIRIGSPYLRERIRAIIARLNMGRNLGEAMLEAGYNFPENEIAGEVSIYAELGNFDEALDMLAIEWIDNSVEKVQTAGKLINNAMLILIALTIGGIALAMLDLQQAVGAAAQK